MRKKEDLLVSIGRIVEAAQGKINGKDIHPTKPVDKEEAVAAIVRRWFKRSSGSDAEKSDIRTRIKNLTAKSEATQETARRELRNDQFLTKQPEFTAELAQPVMDKVIDKVTLPAWLPKSEITNPYIAEAAARIALLPDPEDPAAVYEQLTIMYRSAKFSTMTDGEIREFRKFADLTKGEIIRMSKQYPDKKFHVSADDDMEFPWNKKIDIYQSRRLAEVVVDASGKPVDAINQRRANLDAYLRDRQDALEVEDPRKIGKSLRKLRDDIKSKITVDTDSHNLDHFNQTEANEYIGIINKKLEAYKLKDTEDRWTPISEESTASTIPAVAGEKRGSFRSLFVVDPSIVEKLSPEVREYYKKVLDVLGDTPDKDIKRGTIDQFLTQLEMLSRGREPGNSRQPEQDAAFAKLREAIEGNINSGRLEIPTSIYLSESEVRAMLEDFVGWAEDYMREIERLISVGGTDNPALRPIMDRFHLAQEFYGGKFFQRNLIDASTMPAEDIKRLEDYFAKNYEDRVYVMDEYRVRLLHVEIENQLEFVRDWDPNKQDVQRVNEMTKQLGDVGLFAGRGYQGGMVDVVASNYLLPTMGEKVCPTKSRKPNRWTKQLALETLKDTGKKFSQDTPLYNEQYQKYMMDLRWRAKGRAYVQADIIVEDRLRTSGVVVLPEVKERMKRIEFEKIVNEKLDKGELRFGSLNDADRQSTIDSIVRSAYSSARLQFQVKEKLSMSKGPREAAIEDDFSAFVFTAWEERMQKADYFMKTHKMRWGMEPHEKAMWRQGNEYTMTVDKDVKKYAEREANNEWNSFNAWWEQFHGTLPAGSEWAQVEAQLNAFKASANPAEQALYDQYVHFTEEFLSYPHNDEIGSPVGVNQKDTYEFFHELRTDKLNGKKKFKRQIRSYVTTTWQEDHLTRAYNYWKSGERTKAYKKELKSVFASLSWAESDVDKYYFKGQSLFGKAREYFMPNQHARSHESRDALLREIRGQSGYHPLQFIQLEQRVEGIAGFNDTEFADAERRFHMIQGIILARTKEDPGYKPIDYLNPTAFQRQVVHEVFAKVQGGDLRLSEDEYLRVMKRYAEHVQLNAVKYTDMKYATMLGREILFYDDQPQAIINPEHTETASKGASNLYSRALIDQVLAMQMADLSGNSMTLDLKELDQISEQIRVGEQGYQGEQDGAVAKAYILARYAGYTRGRVDLLDAVLRNKPLSSEAQEFGKAPGAPANSPLELEEILGKAQRTERIENWSPLFGEGLEEFAGISSWSKITGRSEGSVSKLIGERRYHKAIRYLNEHVPTRVTLARSGNTILFFGVTTGLFIAKEFEGGGEEHKKG